MDRLTFEGNFCDIAMCQETPGGSFCEDGYCSQKKVWERLKEYEDTGLSPDVCRNYKLFEDEAISKNVPFTRIVELMNAEAEGRLIVLPCKVGDTVYHIIDDCTFPADCATTRMCEGCEYRNLFIEEEAFYLCLLTDDWKLRRNYYLTREEAEAAIKGEPNG